MKRGNWFQRLVAGSLLDDMSQDIEILKARVDARDIKIEVLEKITSHTENLITQLKDSNQMLDKCVVLLNDVSEDSGNVMYYRGFLLGLERRCMEHPDLYKEILEIITPQIDVYRDNYLKI